MLRPRFVLFGDSLTQRSFEDGGFGAGLTSAYQRKADVVLRGYSGYNTRWARLLLLKVFPVSSLVPAKLVTVFFGANDAALPDRLGARQHVPVKEYSDNLRAIVEHVRRAGAEDVLLITPGPVHEPARVQHNREERGAAPSTEVPERTNAVAEQYAAAAKRVGQALDAPVLDLWTALQREPGWEALLSDGLHFNEAGQRAVREALLSFIAERLPHLRPDAMPDDFPSHRDIDEACPADSFAES
ncbi:hypothetical protein WJX81_002383 [Elliptochloris bilobata]|uniref:SGNH hydrolase-type esterase domain-containing protein n=1 Tax=Elliptochloris bilobata TaxID=381761 RepID=A0AAW1S5C2_9CHLO